MYILSLMRNQLNILIISIFIFSCGGKYEIIDDVTRFNVSTGEIEILQENGQWIKKSTILKEKEREKNRIETERYNKQQKQLQIFPYSEHKLVGGTGSFKTIEYNWEPIFKGEITNESNWKIEEIDVEIRIYNKTDSIKVRTNNCTIKYYSDFVGVNHTKSDIKIYSENDCGIVNMDKDKYYFGWSFKQIRGYNPSEYNPSEDN